MKDNFNIGELLYHSVHGLCRVNEIVRKKEANKEVLYYSLVPKLSSKMKHRFIIAAGDLAGSGFHPPVSLQEANKILDYLKTTYITIDPADMDPKSEHSFAEDNTTWALAKSVLACSRNEAHAKEQKKRQMLQRAAMGLVREFAFVFGIPIDEAAAKIRKNLEQTSKINPIVAAALENAIVD